MPAALALAAVTTPLAIMTWLRLGEPPDWSLQALLMVSGQQFLTWCWVIGLLGAGHRFLSFGNRALHYLNEIFYPAYILHQTVIVMVGFYVVQWQASVAVKFWVILALSSAIILTLCDLLIKRSNLGRIAFGLKPRAPAAEPAPPLVAAR
jgi:peptidoglycan/LPS O-acetylase OafA/YrhL